MPTGGGITPAARSLFGSVMLNSTTVEHELRRQLARAQTLGSDFVDINSGELHRDIGGYPAPNARMPTVCGGMRKLMNEGDRILSAPPKGNGASLTIRYTLPR